MKNIYYKFIITIICSIYVCALLLNLLYMVIVRASIKAQMAIFTFLRNSKTSKFFSLITISNGLCPKFKVRM